eukprot:c23531_g1_i1 orf=775-2925(-)
MHSLSIPYREFAGARTSSISPLVSYSSGTTIVPLRASCNAVHFEYEHKPNFQEGMRLPRQPVDAERGKISVQKHTDCDALSFDDDVSAATAADEDDDDGVCMRSNVAANRHSEQLSREGTLHNHLEQSSVKGIGCTPRRMHTSRRLSIQPTDVRHAKLSPQNRVDFDMFSVLDDSDVDLDDEDEANKEQDTCVDDCNFMPLSSQSSSQAFNPLDYARVYNLVALRVSLTECTSLAYRLKGHLLNWPRINNIARIEGDDMDWDTKSLLSDGKEGRAEGIEDSLLRAVYGTTAPRGRLTKRLSSAEKLSSHRFRFLKCLSQPGYKATKELQGRRGARTMKRIHKKYYTVELRDCQDQRLSSDTSIESPGFSVKKWMGPSRLLLLDTKYSGQPASKLPMAVQVLLNECLGHQKRGPRRELVPCKLTLYYEYWSMEEIISHLLPQGEMMPLSIKIMGHIAVLSLGEQYSFVKHLIAKVVINKHRPRVKTVINKLEPVEGRYHSTLEVLAGNHSVVTTIIEDKISFLVNLATVYWDSELAPERQRLIQRFSKKDVVCDVFAGAGSLALTAAQKVWRVFANDANPEALKYLAKNVVENKLQAKVELYNLDCRMFIRKLLAFKNPVLMTQVVFSLPMSKETIIDALKGAFNRDTWPESQPLPTLHVYGYCDALHPETDFYHLIVHRLGLMAEAVETHRVKQVESGRWLICASFQLPEALAFDE